MVYSPADMLLLLPLLGLRGTENCQEGDCSAKPSLVSFAHWSEPIRTRQPFTWHRLVPDW